MKDTLSQQFPGAIHSAAASKENHEVWFFICHLEKRLPFFCSSTDRKDPKGHKNSNSYYYSSISSNLCEWLEE